MLVSGITLKLSLEWDLIPIAGMETETPSAQVRNQNEYNQDSLCSLKPQPGSFHQPTWRVLSKNSLIYSFIHLISVLYPKIILK